MFLGVDLLDHVVTLRYLNADAPNCLPQQVHGHIAPCKVQGFRFPLSLLTLLSFQCFD